MFEDGLKVFAEWNIFEGILLVRCSILSIENEKLSLLSENRMVFFYDHFGSQIKKGFLRKIYILLP